jgi:hypothetical protein
MGKTVALKTKFDMEVDLTWILWLIAKGSEAFKLSWWCGTTWISGYLLTAQAPAPAREKQIRVYSSYGELVVFQCMVVYPKPGLIDGVATPQSSSAADGPGSTFGYVE